MQKLYTRDDRKNRVIDISHRLCILALGALIIALYLAAPYWKKATKEGIIAGMAGGFLVCVVWKLAGVPFVLGATAPGAIVCGILLVGVSLDTYKQHPCEMA